MGPLQKLFYNIFCINLIDSPANRRWLLVLHLTMTVATFVFVNLNRETTFIVPFAIEDASSVAVRVWFYFYIGVYVTIFFEGYLKDVKFTQKYNSVIKGICEKQTKTKKDFYTRSIYTLLALDLVYLILSYYSELYYQNLHNACLIPKMTIRLRLWSYLYLCRRVLWEFEGIIERAESIPENGTVEDFLKVQHEYSDLWMVSQFIGDYYVCSLCCILFYVFFDLVVYFSWFFTVDFADDRYYMCKRLLNHFLYLFD